MVYPVNHTRKPPCDLKYFARNYMHNMFPKSALTLSTFVTEYSFLCVLETVENKDLFPLLCIKRHISNTKS